MEKDGGGEERDRLIIGYVNGAQGDGTRAVLCLSVCLLVVCKKWACHKNPEYQVQQLVHMQCGGRGKVLTST